jgi:outer membrane protein assembly factor BamB
MIAPRAISAIILSLLLSVNFSAQDRIPEWSHFRGSQLNGISTETEIPVTWNDSTNIAWKTAIPGSGWSSPIVFGEQVWLTTATNGGKEMRALCLNFNTGEILLDRILFSPDTLYRKHSINTYATPTGAVEKGFVYLHFGR